MQTRVYVGREDKAMDEDISKMKGVIDSILEYILSCKKEAG